MLIQISTDVTIIRSYNFIDFEGIASSKMDMFEYDDHKSYLLDGLKAV